jgi:protein SDA1
LNDEEAPDLIPNETNWEEDDLELEEGESFTVEEILSDNEFSDGTEFSAENDDSEDLSEESIAEDIACDTVESPQKKQKTQIATQKIFTDEDFAKIRQLKEEQEVNMLTGRRLRGPVDYDEAIDEKKIMAFTRKKDDYEARMESIKEGRKGREYGSKRGKEERSSTTNRVRLN